MIDRSSVEDLLSRMPAEYAADPAERERRKIPDALAEMRLVLLSPAPPNSKLYAIDRILRTLGV